MDGYRVHVWMENRTSWIFGASSVLYRLARSLGGDPTCGRSIDRLFVDIMISGERAMFFGASAHQSSSATNTLDSERCAEAVAAKNGKPCT